MSSSTSKHLVHILFCARTLLGGVVVPLRGEDVSAPVILQYFESRYETIEERTADIFKSGYGALYTPPSNRADQGNLSVGYDPYDRFDLGGPGSYTLYGSETGLKVLVSTLHKCAMDYYLDFVINHNGYSTLNSKDGNGNSFYDAGGYPGMCITLPEAVDGDFHSAYDYSTINGRLAGLIDIDHGTNFRFYRNPVPGIVPGAGDGGNIRPGTKFAFGRIANVPDNNNRRFYPDRSLQPIMVYDPITGEQNIAVYPFNLGSPLNGTPQPENVTGYLMRNAQWLVQTVGADGFRLDAAKHVQGFALDYFDRAVYRTSFRNFLNGQQKNIFSFCEVYDGDQNYLQTFIKKTIDSNNPGRIGGNRDTLDFPLYFALHDNLTSNGFNNDWHNIENASLDLHDDGLHNGSQGVMFVASHDNFGPDLSNIAYCYMLMHPGNAIVYFNAQEFGTNRDFPKSGRGDALGGVYGNAIPGLVDIRNRYGRGNYLERWIEKENFAYERSGSCVVLLSNRVDSGYDSRTILTNFNPGTRLIELTGNAASTSANPFHDVPELIQVNGDKSINIRFLRNVAPGTNNFTGNGYLVYGLPSPQGSLTLTNVASTLPGGTLDASTNGSVRINDIKVISANSFQVKLNTNAVNLLGSIREHEADGDNALLRMDGGLDLNGNGFVDYTTPGSANYGFEEFVTQHNPGYFSADGNGVYVQTIDATKLSEGLHFLTVRCFRHRDDGGPAIFTDFRQTLYIDRLKPVSAVASFNPLVTGVNQNRQLLIRSSDLTANNVHAFLDLPASLTDAQVLGMVSAGTQAGKLDRDLFAYGFNNLTNGNHVFTVVSYERTGNVNVQRFPGNYTSTLNGLGLGDANFDGTFSPADIDIFRTLINSHNTQFNPAADMNGDGVIDLNDLNLLGQVLTNANADSPTLKAYDQLVSDLSPFNYPPIAVNDSVTAVQDTALQIPAATLLANDSPGPGSERVQSITLTAVSALSARGGSVVLNNNVVTYTPPQYFNGLDSFTYTITDNGTSNGQPNPKSASATVSVTVTEVNHAPVANADALSTSEDVALTVASSVLSANDSPGPPNESGQTLTVTAVSSSSAKGGVVSLSAGKITYTPAAFFNGSDTFTYVVTDNGTTHGAPDFKSASGTVTVTVTEVNHPPVANPDTLNAVENIPKTIGVAVLLANDTPGPANESAQTLTLTAVSANSSAGGSVALNGSNITYTPPQNFSGSDTFSYTIVDNGTTHGMPDPKSATGVVNVTVSEVNAPPVANPDALAASLNTPKTFSAANLTLNDSPGPPNESGQTLTVTGVSAASAKGGSVSLSGGNITYTPHANFIGSDSFTYTVTDNGTTAGAPDPKTASGTVNVTVSNPAGNQPPVVGADHVTTPQDTVLNIPAATLLANDTPGPPVENAQTIVVTAVSAASTGGGTVALNGTTVTYTPPALFNGNDSFTYTITDNGAPPMSASGSVFVIVTEVNHAPTAAPDAQQTSENVPLNVAAGVLLANDSPGPANESGQTLTLVSVSAASTQGGTVSLKTGTVTYTPPVNFNGSDTFTYTISDNGTTHGAPDPKSAIGTVTVSVFEVNAPPVTVTYNIGTAENTQLTIAASALLVNDSPGPSNESTQTLTLTAVSASSMKGGTVGLSNSLVTYTPPAGFFGADSFTYMVIDNGTTHGMSDPKSAQGLVNVLVTQVNAPPSANPDNFATSENAALSIPTAAVLANDAPGPANESAQTITVTGVSAASANGGSVILDGMVITYTPPLNFSGSDTFSYTITDNGTTNNLPDPKSASGTVTVAVSEVNHPPIAQPDSVTTRQDTPLPLDPALLLANDTPGPPNESAQSITVSAVDAKSSQGGSVVFAAGKITYTPPAKFIGNDSFKYTITDNGTTGGAPDPMSASALVTVSVIAVNQPPIAFPDSLTAERNTPLIFSTSVLLANDVPGPPAESAQKLTVNGVMAHTSAGGSASLNGSTISYTPPQDFTGGDSFNYSILDNGTTGGQPDFKSATGVVNVNVVATNQAPVIQALNAPVTQALISQELNFSVAASDPDGDPLSITWDYGDGSADSGVSVTHAYSSAGNFVVTVRADDGRGLSSSASVTVAVSATGFSIVKVQLNLNFSPRKSAVDSMLISGLVRLPDGFVIAGTKIDCTAGGIARSFVLDKRGKSARQPGGAQFFLSTHPKNALSKFFFAIKKNALSAALAANGFTNQDQSNSALQLPVKINFNGSTFDALRALKYSAKHDGAGSAR